MKISKKYESDVVSIHWDERGFFLLEMKNTNAEYDLQETINQFDYFITTSNNTPYKVIVNTVENLVLPTDESLQYFFKHNKEENKIAIVTTQLPMQLIVRFMYKYENVQNTKMFRDLEEAIQWIIKD